MHIDRHGPPVKVGDRIQPPGCPIFAVTVNALVDCMPDCANGAAVIADPETGEPDEVCLSTVELVR